MSETVLERVKQLATQLSRAERMRLAGWLEATLDNDVAPSSQPSSRSLYGLLADLESSPTEADIDQARQEIWATFPREDIA